MTTVGLAALALLVALTFPGVVGAVVFSTLVAPAAVFVPMMLGLYWKRPTAAAGFSSLVTAALVGVLSQVLWYRTAPGWLGAIHPLFLGPAAGLAVFLLVAGVAGNRRSS
jgi:SSS family solute:Na+ symporter